MKLPIALALALTSYYVDAAPYSKRTTGLETKAASCAKPKGVVGYWGQNSAGIGNSDRSTWEKPLKEYCASDTYDKLVLGFLNIFPSDARNPGEFKPPTLNFAYHCETTFPEYPFLLKCPEIAAGIDVCKRNGKKVVLSIGGATGPYGFTNDDQARDFANVFYNMFLKGRDSKYPRPFGESEVDGVDLDIEAGGSTGYAAFVNELKSLQSDTLVGAAPQCVFPDAYQGPGGQTALEMSKIDFIFIQFYNNYCGVNNPSQFNFDAWQAWASSSSLNSDIEIYLGVPSAPKAAGSGYIDLETLKSLSTTVAAKNKNFAGVGLWEVSLAELNNDYGGGIKQHMKTLCDGDTTPPPPPPVATKTQPAPPQTSAVGKCRTTTITVGPEPTGTNPGNPGNGDIVQGQPCSKEGSTGCANDSQYGTCLYGKWLLQSCPGGTVCKSTGSGFTCTFQ